MPFKFFTVPIQDDGTADGTDRERLKGTFNPSPVASDGSVFVSNNDRAAFVVKADKEFEVVTVNELSERITSRSGCRSGEQSRRTPILEAARSTPLVPL